MINHIQNKVFVYIIYVCVLCNVLCIYKYTHTSMYILKKNMLHLYINYIYISNKLFK